VWERKSPFGPPHATRGDGFGIDDDSLGWKLKLPKKEVNMGVSETVKRLERPDRNLRGRYYFGMRRDKSLSSNFQGCRAVPSSVLFEMHATWRNHANALR
jgi:hypothetical protein